MTGEKKIDYVLDLLNESSQITPFGQNVTIELSDYILKGISLLELNSILQKLQDDFKIINSFRVDKDLNTGFVVLGYYGILSVELGNNFKEFLSIRYKQKKLDINKLEGINLIKVLAMVDDLCESLQMRNDNKVVVDYDQYRIKYIELFAYQDSVSARRQYNEYRREALKLFENDRCCREYPVLRWRYYWFGL